MTVRTPDERNQCTASTQTSSLQPSMSERKLPLKLVYDITILDQDHTNDEAVNSFDEFQSWGRATSLLFLPRIPAMIIGMMLRITM